MTVYVICQAETPSLLALEVQRLAEHGYMPVAGFQALGRPATSQRLFYQAMGFFQSEPGKPRPKNDMWTD